MINPSKHCYVYIIQTESGLYKIGITKEPTHRYRILATAIAEPSRILLTIECEDVSYARDVEYKLHYALKDYRMTGEWFKAPKEVLAIAIFDNAISISICNRLRRDRIETKSDEASIEEKYCETEVNTGNANSNGKLVCSGCGYSWTYRGKKRPIKREGKQDKTVYVTCPQCANRVPMRAKDLQEEREG